MTYNTNRLSLPTMVDKQLKERPQKGTEVFFSPNFVRKSSDRSADDYRRNGYEQTKLMTSFNSVVATIHNKLQNTKKVVQREEKLAENTKAAEPQPENAVIAVTPPQAVPNKKMSAKARFHNTVMRVHLEPKSPLGSNEYKLQSIMDSKSIPRLKALQEHRHQQRLRRSIQQYEDFQGTSKQRRVDEIAKQKRILENMLHQHQQLQRSRQSIASEIQLMRDHLTQIRDRLDTSLKRLNMKTTISARMPRKKHKSLVVQSLSVTANAGGAVKSANEKTGEVVQSKSMEIKRPHVSPKRSIRGGSSPSRKSKSPGGSRRKEVSVVLNRSRSPNVAKRSKSPMNKK